MDTVVDVFIALCALGTIVLSAVFAFGLITLIGKARTAGASVGGGSESPSDSGSSVDPVEDGELEPIGFDVDALGTDVPIDYELDPDDYGFDFDPVFDPWLYEP